METTKELSLIEQIEMKFWCDTYTAVASSSNCIGKDVPKVWANIALDEFRKKFNLAQSINNNSQP